MDVSLDNLVEQYEISQRNFQSIVEKIDDKKTYEKALRQSNKKYDIKNFKVTNMTPVKARKIFPALIEKYRENLAQQQSWLQNQRRLFVWLVLCYMFVSSKTIPQLKTSKDFVLFSSIFNNKKQDFLKFQLFALIKKEKKEAKWNQDQDEVLRKVLKMDKFETEEIQWNEVSKQFFQLSEHKFYRSSKHCRQRWMNHLDPNKVKGMWASQQDLILLKFVKEKGKKWSQIVKFLDDCKTQHMVKNRYNSLVNKKGKSINSKNQQKILNRLIEQMQSSDVKNQEEQFKTSSRQGFSFLDNKSEPIKSQKNDEFPNIFQNDSSLNSGKRCKFFVQRAGSLSMSERGGLLPELANPILEQMDSQQERSRQKFLISTPLSQRGYQMKSPYHQLNSPLLTGNGGNVTPSMFFLQQNVKTTNNGYGSEFSLSFSSNFDKFVPQ